MPSNTPDQSSSSQKPRPQKKGLLYIFSVAILVIIAISFVGGPALTGFMDDGAPRIVVGYYDGEPIEFAQGTFFERQFRTLAQQQPESQAQNPELHRYQLLEQAFNQAVFHEAVQQTARKSGMTVSSERIDQELAQHPAFLENGRFSSERYREMPSSERQGLRDFLRASILQQKYLEDIVQSPHFSERERDALKHAARTERRFQFAEFRFDDISDDDLERYFSEHAEEFAELSISQITVVGEEDAASVYGQLDAESAPFEELAQTYSDDPWAAAGGERGWVARQQLEQELGAETTAELFDAVPGTVVGPLETEEGYRIVRVNEPARDLDIANEEHRERVREQMLTVAPDALEERALERAEEFAGAASGEFLAAAEQYGVELGATEYFPVNYGNSQLFGRVRTVDGGGIADAAQRESFFEAAFKLQPGETSAPIELEDRYVILRFEDERTLEPGEDDILETQYAALLQDWKWRELDRTLFDPERVESRVVEVFFQYFSSQGQ